MARRRNQIPELITSARISRTLDTGDRTKRYFLSMAVRVACFLAGCFAPFPANLGLFVGAAIIPGVAVILANAVDQRSGAVATPHTEASDLPALTAGLVVPGHVTDAPHPGAAA